MPQPPQRPRSTLLTVLALWLLFYCSFTLFTPPLLDDADSVHAEVAREMLLRHDYVTLYANGIRYLEKAPLMYWSMAACMRVSQLFGAASPHALAAAARVPIALSVLLLALIAEALARRMFHSQRAGLYTALILLSSPGIFLFARITLPDTMLCLFTTCAMYCFWRMEELELQPTLSSRPEATGRSGETRRLSSDANPHEAKLRFLCGGFAAACALNVLTKGLIGIVFPLAITLLYLALTRGLRGGWQRLRALHPLATCEAFLLIAAPWHILAGLANPTQGHPTPFHFVNGHWQVPLPTDGNVRGWFWFYFMNEHLLRYLNLRVPHDYDTSPLWLFWGLCFVWLMPFSAFIFGAVANAMPLRSDEWRRKFRENTLPPYRKAQILTLLWAGVPLLFFSLSTRQEYYVLPALPGLALLLTEWLTGEAKYRDLMGYLPEAYSLWRWKAASRGEKKQCLTRNPHLTATVCTLVLLILGAIFALATAIFLFHTKAPAPDTDLATLLAQNPGDYALSMGHFLDLNAQALGLFRLPLTIAAISLFGGPLAALLLRRQAKPHAANLALAAGAFGFLAAAFLALRTFSPVLTSAQLAETIATQVQPGDAIVIHGEYEAGSTLGFYLQRPTDFTTDSLGNTPEFGIGPHLFPINPVFILEGRSSNLWYGSFFPDAPHIFVTPAQLALSWNGPTRIFMWQSLTDQPNQLPNVPGPIYVLAKSGGKEIISNQPNR